MKYKFKHGTVI